MRQLIVIAVFAFTAAAYSEEAPAAPEGKAVEPTKAEEQKTTAVAFGKDSKSSLQIPAAWKSETPSNNMRLAQVKVPKSSGDNEDAELTVTKASGGADANIQRWAKQFGGAESIKDKRAIKTAAGLEVTVVELEGTYTAMTMQGSQPPKDNYKMLAAIIVTEQNEFYVKLPGPKKTIDDNRTAFENMIKSFK